MPRTVSLTVVRKNASTTERQQPETLSDHRRQDSQLDHHLRGRFPGSSVRTRTHVVPSSPVEFLFFRQKLATGLRCAVGVVAGVGIGVFLATHVSTTPPLHLKVAFVSAVSFLLGLSLVPMTIRNLFGRLRVDSRGIRMAPKIFGFRVDWDDLERWSIEGITLHFKSRRCSHPYILDLHDLAADERHLLRELMRSCAPEKDRRAANLQEALLAT